MRVATKRIIGLASLEAKKKQANKVDLVFLLRITLTFINIFIIYYGFHWEANELYIKHKVLPYGGLFLSIYSVLAISIIFYYIEKQIEKTQQGN